MADFSTVTVYKDDAVVTLKEKCYHVYVEVNTLKVSDYLERNTEVIDLSYCTNVEIDRFIGCTKTFNLGF